VEVADGTEANRWRSLNMLRRNRFAAVETCRKRWLRRPRFLASTSFGRKPASTPYRLHRTFTAYPGNARELPCRPEFTDVVCRVIAEYGRASKRTLN